MSRSSTPRRISFGKQKCRECYSWTSSCVAPSHATFKYGQDVTFAKVQRTEVNFPKVPLAAATWFALLLFASCNPEFLSWFEVWWMRDEGEEECSMEQTRGLAHSRLQNRGRLWNNIFVLHWITNVVKRRQSKILTWRQSNTENEQTNASYIERITILDNVKHEGTDIHEQCKSKRTPSDGRRTMPPKVPSKCEKKTPSYLKMCEKQNSKMLLLLLSRNRFRSYKNAESL